MAVRAVRGAIQLERDDKMLLLDAVKELFQEVLDANGLDRESLISVIFTSTPDLRCGFPAVAVRELGLSDVPLMCAQELDIQGALPRTVRLLLHVDTVRAKSEIRHVYLGGAAALRRDLAPLAAGAAA
ncbi:MULTISPECIES: chorismate mutase [Streptomyces]|uniref:chorismate mutase n=1 Tax=Streptomyces TaxID=1883 RepID=UPI000C272382|nr:chorismate mutase [Streptomyces sp. CB01201]MBX7467775.1 chorismate mutase [Streptomyces sp. MAG02]PJN02275.1 chorismate mutase [Streptomyces sp. CB01201]